MASAVSATRARAPGGSFIWPNTSAVLDKTPDSSISLYKSFPSRVRSPTPANMEYPPCSDAMLRINSWIITVLPTPAPPKSPTLPPFKNGQSKSITFIPVSKTSDFDDCSVKSGALRWIGYFLVTFGSGFSSIASPITLNMRPSVISPTGTEMGAPVSFTSMPLSRPSVDPMATARTVPEPKCCCTSRTSRSPFSRCTSSAL